MWPTALLGVFLHSISTFGPMQALEQLVFLKLPCGIGFDSTGI